MPSLEGGGRDLESTCRKLARRLHSMQSDTYRTAIRLSLGLVETRCLALHIRMRDHAPIASQSVHNTAAVGFEGERNVVNKERYSGDCDRISSELPPWKTGTHMAEDSS